MASDSPRLTPGLAVGLAGAIVATAAVVLASSAVVLSRRMSWDLLFNLAGAWQLHHGGVAHIDFHDPVGQLYFWLTQLGFWLCGPTPWAFVAGDIIAAVAVFIAAAAVSLPRLPAAAAMVFILFTSLIVLMPVNVGDGPTSFTFAMSYNVQSWAAISVLSLILFLPRRQPRTGACADAAIGAVLIVAMYYLKVSYFAAALGELAVAFVACRHVRRLEWLVVGALVAANAVAPYNWPYLTDLASVLALPHSLAAYAEPSRVNYILRTGSAELIIYTLAVAIAIGLWLWGRAPWRLPATMAFLVATGIAVMAFNTQAAGMPLAVVALFLLYQHLQADSTLRRAAPALLAYPLWLALTAGASVAAYHVAAGRTDKLLVVDRTNLRGLAVPDSDVRRKPGEEIGQDDYVETVLEGADLLKLTGNGGQGAVVFDVVNPMAFVLGLPPRRGAQLWLDIDFPWHAPGSRFEGAHHVLVPKHPVKPGVTRKALDLYGAYLGRNFPVRTESPNWTLLSRAP